MFAFVGRAKDGGHVCNLSRNQSQAGLHFIASSTTKVRADHLHGSVRRLEHVTLAVLPVLGAGCRAAACKMLVVANELSVRAR